MSELRVRRLTTAELSPPEIEAIRSVLWAAFGDDPEEAFTESDWDHARGGIHVVADVDGRIVAHASVVPRELHIAGRRLATGYVEAVAVQPGEQGRGLGTAVMREVDSIIVRRVRAGRPRDGRTRLLRAAGLADLARAVVGADGRGRSADAGRRRLHPRARDTDVAAARPGRADQLRLAARRCLVTGPERQNARFRTMRPAMMTTTRIASCHGGSAATVFTASLTA